MSRVDVANVPGGFPGYFPKPPIWCWVSSNRKRRIGVRSTRFPSPMIWRYDLARGHSMRLLSAYIERGPNPKCVARVDWFITAAVETDALAVLER
jgi:hypothetical protein